MIKIFTARSSTRFLYVANWIFREVLGAEFEVCTDKAQLHDGDCILSYGSVIPDAISIPDEGLLWEKGIDANRKVTKVDFHGTPAFFATDNHGYTIPFDIFSATFFLLSRYEEYYPYAPDKHGRYPATDSILYKNNCLEQPVIDLWLHQLANLLKEKTKLNITPFSFQPTYDIDIAFSYRFKGLKRTVGALAKDVSAGNIQAVKERLKVLRGKKHDPYDSFFWLQQMHNVYRYSPIYFVLASLHTTAFDKNIHPHQAHMRKLILRFGIEGKVGMHPSYYSDSDNTVFKNEKRVFEAIIGYKITASRQHYIKLKMPDTYQRLMKENITDDYSMGYSTYLGFRAGTGRSFFWYDLKNDTATDLRVHPFCFMDTTAHFDMGLPVEEAFTRLNKMKDVLQHTNGRLITIFHNFSLGYSPEWKGWADAYANFLREMKQETTS